MRQGNDTLSWTSDALSINPCSVAGGSNNTQGCAESQRPTAIPFWSHPSVCWKLMAPLFDGPKWGSDLRSGHRSTALTSTSMLSHHCHIQNSARVDILHCKYIEHNTHLCHQISATFCLAWLHYQKKLTVRSCTWINCERGRCTHTICRA